MLVRPTVYWLLYVYCTDSYLVYNYCSVVHYCTAKQKGRETVVQTSAAIIYSETDLSHRIQCSTISDTTCAISVEYRTEQYRTADRAEYSEIVIMKTTLWYSVVYPRSVIGYGRCTENGCTCRVLRSSNTQYSHCCTKKWQCIRCTRLYYSSMTQYSACLLYR